MGTRSPAVLAPKAAGKLKGWRGLADVRAVGDPYQQSQEDGISLSEALGELDESKEAEHQELSSFLTHPGVGRVLCVGNEVARQVEQQLSESQYEVGHVEPGRTADELAKAASTFQPDLIYVSLCEPTEVALTALESLSSDERTQALPLLALVPEDAPASLIEEAYSRTGCDFFRLSHTRIELLARTHLLVRLNRAVAGISEASGRPMPMGAANDPTAGRIDLRDSASNLFSSGYFFHRFPAEVSRARRYERALSVLAIRCRDAKIDESKALTVSAVLAKHLRASDVCSRIEPDLFVALLPEVTSDCLDGLQERIEGDLRRTGYSVGFGRAGLEGMQRGSSPQELLERARAQASESVR